jgi:glycosyltransferase involved in cell wall biosynthesis
LQNHRGERLNDPGAPRVVIAYTEEMRYPASQGNAKIYYISMELIRRGNSVTWARLGPTSGHWEKDGIEFVSIGRLCHPAISPWLQLIQLTSYCRKTRASCVYLDDWMFLREYPGQRLFFQMGLRALGIKCVCDQRDPYIDFEIAQGRLKERSWEHTKLAFMYRLIFEFTDLSIFPSRVYEEEMRNRGLSAWNSLGVIRGVDIDRFKDTGEGTKIRTNLGLEGKFVIGWFGTMLPYRSIEEALIPLIENAATKIPNAHFLIGGFGPLQSDFEKLKERHPDANLTLLGYVPYEDMPKYVSACDVLLCPLSAKYRFTLNASPLKILESVAVGRPIIATSINVRDSDYKDIKGVIWTGTGYEDFLQSLDFVHKNYRRYREEAERQAEDFEAFSTRSRIAELVDGIEKCCSR